MSGIRVEPKILVREFKDKLEEQLFVIDCNLIRRQLNNFQKTELALKSKPILEAKIDNQSERTKQETERLRAQEKEKLWAEITKLYRNHFEKLLEYDKAYAAFYFWTEYRVYKIVI